MLLFYTRSCHQVIVPHLFALLPAFTRTCRRSRLYICFELCHSPWHRPWPALLLQIHAINVIFYPSAYSFDLFWLFYHIKLVFTLKINDSWNFKMSNIFKMWFWCKICLEWDNLREKIVHGSGFCWHRWPYWNNSGDLCREKNHFTDRYSVNSTIISQNEYQVGKR